MIDTTQTSLGLADLVTTQQIVELLYKRHSGDDWLCFDEVRIGTGYGKDAEQRLDFWAIEAIPSKRFRRAAYEIKISRSDFLKEIRNPYKRRRGLLLSNEFYFVAPVGMIKPDELPIEAGLIEVRTHQGWGGGFYLDTTHAAPWRDTPAPPWSFVCALIRRAKKATP